MPNDFIQHAEQHTAQTGHFSPSGTNGEIVGLHPGDRQHTFPLPADLVGRSEFPTIEQVAVSAEKSLAAESVPGDILAGIPSDRLGVPDHSEDSTDP
jgi:hypothetical protein